MTDGSLVKNNNIFQGPNNLIEQSGLHSDEREEDDYCNFDKSIDRRYTLSDMRNGQTPEGFVLNYSYLDGGVSPYQEKGY
jgi:hypothetical protein